MNRRGDVTDIPVIAILVIIIAMTSIIGVMIINQVRTSDDFQEVATNESLEAMAQAETAMGMFDSLLVFLFFSAIAVGVISAFLVAAHPVFFVLYMIVMLIMAALTTVFANIYYEFASSSLISAYSNQFTWTDLLMQNLPLTVLVGMILIAIVMFGKTSSSRGGGY